MEIEEVSMYIIILIASYLAAELLLHGTFGLTYRKAIVPSKQTTVYIYPAPNVLNSLNFLRKETFLHAN